MPRQLISSNTPFEHIAGYSRAVRVGNLVFVAGTTASDAAGQVQHLGDAAAQTAYILRKIERSQDQSSVDTLRQVFNKMGDAYKDDGIWTTTAANAYQANGIGQFESIVAQGPSIGIETADPCEECIDNAASGPFDMESDLPPWHPNCRCEAIPVLEGEDGDPWLPPAEPWTGGDLPLAEEEAMIDAPEIEASRGPSAAYLEKLERVRKRARGVR